MILPDFILPSRVNQRWQYSGIDSPENCNDKQYFQSYPHAIEYCYNSRGYRDQEWPTELLELQNSIWCIGDSFTVGLGNPIEHTWPYILQQQTSQRTINVSMDGASNEWMARKIKRIVEVIAPKTIVVQWSYFPRRELPSNADDEKRIMRYHPLQLEDEINIENFKNCVLETIKICKNCQIINSIIPDAFSGIHVKEVQGWWWSDKELPWPAKLPILFTDIPLDTLQQLKKKQQYNKYFIHYTLQDFIKNNNMILVDQLDEFFVKDLSRDGHHYGIATATKFVNEVQTKFKLV
jgi:hypothetical protein